MPVTSFGQVFEHLSEQVGTPRILVSGIAQDHRGFIWFTTTDGLYRYDSKSYKHYRHDPKNNRSLSSDYLSTIFCDSRGDLWIGSSNGLNRYEPDSDSFTRFIHNPGDSNSIGSGNILCITEDRDKKLWVSTRFRLSYAAIKNGHYKFTGYPGFYQEKPGEYPPQVNAIAFGEKNELWLATDDGFFRVKHGKTIAFKPKQDARLPPMNDFLSIYYDGSGNIWLGLYEGGLLRFDIASQRFEFIDNFKDENGAWPVINAFLPDKNSKLWIATRHGLARFDVRTRKANWYVNSRSNRHSVADNTITSIFKDKQLNLWVGTSTMGVDYLNMGSPEFSVWPYFFGSSTNNEFLSGQAGITPGQRMWKISYDKRQLLLYDKLTGKKSQYSLPLNFAQNTDRFYVDQHDLVWYADNWTLHSYDLHSGRYQSYRFPGVAPDWVWRETFSINEDKQGRLWLCGQYGLLVFDTKTGIVQETGIRKYIINSFEDSQGNVWAGGYNEVWLFRKGTGKPERIMLSNDTSIKDEGAYLPGRDVNRITQDRIGRIWLVYGQGLRLYEAKSHRFLPYPKYEVPLLSDLNDIQADSKGYLWLSRGFELIRYHPYKRSLQSYSDQDGLPKDGLLGINTAFADSTGMLYFNTSRGPFSFDPNKVSAYDRPSAIVATRLRLFNEEVRAGDKSGILKHEISRQKQLIFRAEQNVFTLDFSLLSYARSRNNSYMYKLEGFEKNWNTVSVPTATYTNLPAGEYTFQVRAANGDGYWMKNNLKLKIIVLSPWWETWYAYLFYILLTAAAIYAITRFFWLRTSFRKENALNQVKLEFFTNVSHEIRTHLSLISGPLEKAYQQATEDTGVRNYLTYARHNSDRLMLLVDELLDFRKIQSGSVRLQVREHDVVKIIKSVIASFEHTAKEKNIETSLICPDAPVLLWFDIAQMQKVFYNLLSNAYKFTPEGGKVSVRITEISNEVNITVKDSGKGMSAEHLRKLFTYYYQADSEKPGYGIGLALSKSIVEQHRGYLTAESRLASDASPGETSHGSTTLTIRMLRENQHFSPDQIAAKVSDPVESMLTETIAVPVNHNASPAKQANTILIIEDNDQLRVFIRELFEGEFNTLEAGNGLQGLELANEHIPDIILSDVMMPGMNGLEVCSRLKNNVATSHIPVVLLTARTQSEQVIEGLTVGADDYLAKPFNPRILELKINNLIRLRDDLKERYRESALEGQQAGGSIARDMNDAFVAKLRAVVTEHISDANFGVNELAVQAGMSVSALYRKMRSLTGMTVNEFVKAIRLNEAKKLLESGVYNVSEVASIVGFEDSRHFSIEFKKVFGKNPNEIKKQISG